MSRKTSQEVICGMKSCGYHCDNIPSKYIAMLLGIKPSRVKDLVSKGLLPCPNRMFPPFFSECNRHTCYDAYKIYALYDFWSKWSEKRKADEETL